MSATVKEKFKAIGIPVVLFLVTIATTLLSGVQWMSSVAGPYSISQLLQGWGYSFSILFILAVHEFGHYFAALYHRVKTTLPYFIPFIGFDAGLINFGTLGAVIKTKSQIQNTRMLFDIGVGGPVAGFIAACIVLAYGFITLPPVEYLLKIHPDYFTQGYGNYAFGLQFGNNILYLVFQKLFAPKGVFIPPMSEMYHYPFLCAGWFGLFITSMNLIPVGQLDGGHISYALFGEKRQEQIASLALIILIVMGAFGLVNTFVKEIFPFGWAGWMFWAAVLYFVIKAKHPPVPDEIELTRGRKLVGYFSIFIFIVSFTPTPFTLKIFP